MIAFDYQCRFLIVENYGDFEQCFNIGTVPGGFGSSTGGNFAPSSSSSAAKSAPKKRNLKDQDGVSASPVEILQPVPTQQILIDEYLKMTNSRKALQKLFEEESDEEEKTTQTLFMESITKRRKEMAEMLAPKNDATSTPTTDV